MTLAPLAGKGRIVAEVMARPSSNAVETAHVGLQKTMARAGWHIDYVDLDLTKDRPVVTIKCHRSDGRWLRAAVDALGRCTLETFQRQSWLGHPENTKGRWPMSPQSDDLFLGRVKPEGPRTMLRAMTAYIVDNASQPVAIADMRAAWASVMHEPTKIEYVSDKD